MEQHPLKRKFEESEIPEEEILREFSDDLDFANMLIQSQRNLKTNVQDEIMCEVEAPSASPSWKQEVNEKIGSAKSLEEVNQIAKELLKKNKIKKPVDKKLVRVENFYQRHIQGIRWMENFLKRTKEDAISKPYVQRMLELEYKMKKMIEDDEVLKSHLSIY